MGVNIEGRQMDRDESRSETRKRIGRNLAVIAGTMLMAGVTAPLIVPIRPLEGTVAPEDLADSESRFVLDGGLKLHTRQSGSGDGAFLLIHGHLHSLETWRDVAPLLGEIGRVVSWDRPGFGLSTRPLPGRYKGPNPYASETQADGIPGLMDMLGVGRATLIGASTGAAIAARAAERFPERFDRLVLVSPVISGHGTQRWLRIFMSTPQMKRLGPVLLRAKITEELERLFTASWHDPSRITPERWEIYRRLFRVHDWDRGLWEEARTARKFEELCRAEQLRVPTLVVAGDHDRVAGTQAIIRLAASIPHAYLALLPECGHLPQEEDPPAFVAALREFINLPARA
jgi:pimeloyl-ACP methyl ester carboxylesterase